MLAVEEMLGPRQPDGLVRAFFSLFSLFVFYFFSLSLSLSLCLSHFYFFLFHVFDSLYVTFLI